MEMMTPTSNWYAIGCVWGICFFGSLFVAEMVASLRDHNWNIIKTVIDFIKEW